MNNLTQESKTPVPTETTPVPTETTLVQVDKTPAETCDFCAQIAEAGKHSQPPKLSQRGVILLGVSGAFVAGVTAVMMPFVNPGLRRFALPYIPASTEQVGNVLRVLKGRSGNLIDIGSGDGRISIATARRGFHSSGVELNRWLVWYARWAARKQGLQSKTRFFRQDLWKTDFSSYNNIVIFGVESMMPRLQAKLSSEVTPGAAVVACRFPLPTWEPTLTVGEGIDTVWLYLSTAGTEQQVKEQNTTEQHVNEQHVTQSTDGRHIEHLKDIEKS